MILKAVLTISTAFIAGLAASAAPPDPNDVQVPICRFQEHYIPVPIGFRCRTGVDPNKTYERVERNGFGVAWKQADGLIWSESQNYSRQPGDIFDRNIKYFEDAWDRCEALGANLPLVEELVKLGDNRLGWLPMPWGSNTAEWFSSELDIDPNIVRTVHGPSFKNPGPYPDGHTGGADRRHSLEQSTVCVDDSEVVVKKVRPIRPARVERDDL